MCLYKPICVIYINVSVPDPETLIPPGSITEVIIFAMPSA